MTPQPAPQPGDGRAPPCPAPARAFRVPASLAGASGLGVGSAGSRLSSLALRAWELGPPGHGFPRWRFGLGSWVRQFLTQSRDRQVATRFHNRPSLPLDAVQVLLAAQEQLLAD